MIAAVSIRHSLMAFLEAFLLKRRAADEPGAVARVGYQFSGGWLGRRLVLLVATVS